MKIYNKVHNKFILTSTIILLASLILCMAISYFYFEESMTKFAKEELKKNTVSNSETISRFYDEKTRLAIAISEYPLVIKAGKEQADGFRGPNPTDAPTTKISQETFNQIQNYLSGTYSHWSDELENLFMGDVYGYVMADSFNGLSVGILMNVDVRGGNYWRKTFEGNMVFGDLEFSPVPGHENLVSVISIPIKDEKGVIASVGMPVDFDPLSKIIKSKIIGKNGYNIIIDRYGNLLVHPNKEFILKKKLSELEGVGLADISQKMLNKESGFATFVQNNIKYYIYYDYVRPLGQYQGQGLSVASIISEKELLEEADMMRNLTVFLIIMTVLLSSIVTFFISRRITKPIVNLRNAATEIGKGNLDAKIEVESKDEVGELAKSFDDMRLGLKDRNDLLNTILSAFKEKIGGIASILLRDNIQELTDKNPRILSIIPKSIAKLIKKEKEMKKSTRGNEGGKKRKRG